MYPGEFVFQEYIELPQLLYYHVMVPLNESAMVIVGGQSSSDSKEVYLFNQNTGNFTQLPSLPDARAGPFAGW